MQKRRPTMSLPLAPRRLLQESDPIVILQAAQEGSRFHGEGKNAGNNEAPAFDDIEQAKTAAQL